MCQDRYALGSFFTRVTMGSDLPRVIGLCHMKWSLRALTCLTNRFVCASAVPDVHAEPTCCMLIIIHVE